jgi:hypothetical protein
MKTGILNVVIASFCITLAVGTASAAKFESSPPETRLPSEYRKPRSRNLCPEYQRTTKRRRGQ